MIYEVSRHEPDMVQRREGEVILDVSPTVQEQLTGVVLSPVLVHVNLTATSTQADVVRAGRRMGKEAALEEHKIILELLKRRGTTSSVTQVTADEIMRTVDDVSELAYDEIVVLISPKIKYDLVLKEKLIPAWTQTSQENNACYAGMLFGRKYYWSPEIQDNSCFVIGRGSVGIKWTEPEIRFSSTAPTSVGFREEMVCWCIDREGVPALTEASVPTQ